MNKSPPASGGLFYFGQIAEYKVNLEIRSCLYAESKGITEARDRRNLERTVHDLPMKPR